MRYWTKSPGIGGTLLECEDFVVRELLEKKFLRKFSASGRVTYPSKYSLLYVRKRAMTTRAAMQKLSQARETWGFAGLKDKFSVSYQYFTVKSSREFAPMDTTDLSILETRKTDHFLSPGS